MDVLIVGAGVAGLTAAIYAKRAGLTALVFDKNGFGGQVAVTNEIENYPAIERILGFEFAQNLYRQAVDQGAQICPEEVTAASLQERVKCLTTSGGQYEGKAVILATGAKRRKLGLPGEAAFTGRGVSYCATCDGAFFRGKKAAVVGGGNVALEDALFLSNLCEEVTLIHRRDRFTGEQPLIRAVLERQNIRILFQSRVSGIHGTQRLEGITVRTAGREERIALSGLFIAIGYEPDNGVFSGEVRLDEKGYLVAGEDCRTNVPGVFAAGDCRTKELRQIVTAAADGAVAAFHAANEINANGA